MMGLGAGAASSLVSTLEVRREMRERAAVGWPDLGACVCSPPRPRPHSSPPLTSHTGQGLRRQLPDRGPAVRHGDGRVGELKGEERERGWFFLFFCLFHAAQHLSRVSLPPFTMNRWALRPPAPPCPRAPPPWTRCTRPTGPSTAPRPRTRRASWCPATSRVSFFEEERREREEKSELGPRVGAARRALWPPRARFFLTSPPLFVIL